MAFNYGKPFTLNGKKVMYRYTDKKKSTKTLVDSEKNVIVRSKTTATKNSTKKSVPYKIVRK